MRRYFVVVYVAALFAISAPVKRSSRRAIAPHKFEIPVNDQNYAGFNDLWDDPNAVRPIQRVGHQPSLKWVQINYVTPSNRVLYSRRALVPGFTKAFNTGRVGNARVTGRGPRGPTHLTRTRQNAGQAARKVSTRRQQSTRRPVQQRDKSTGRIVLKPGVPISQYPPLPPHLKEDCTRSRMIGQGGEGTIFKVRNARRTKNYALKRVDLVSKGVLDTRTMQRAKAEIDLMVSFKSPFVMTVHQRFYDGRFVYYTMDMADYGDGRRLFVKVHNYFRGGYIAERETFAKLAIRDVVRGMTELHSRGYVHHDVKWDNTLVFKTRIALHDFGMSERLVKNKPANSIRGTIMTLPPEYLPYDGNGIYDDRGDIWGIGIMMFEFLLGFNPFRQNREDNRETIRNILSLKIMLPAKFSAQARDFFAKATAPLGSRFYNIYAVMGHPWFNEVRNVKITEKFSPYIDVGNGESLISVLASIHYIQDLARKHQNK